jgi:hypothetical protein
VQATFAPAYAQFIEAVNGLGHERFKNERVGTAMRREEDVQRVKEGTMKGLTLLLLSAAVAFALAGSANADFAAGGGKTVTDIFNLAAHGGPLGENAYGHMHARDNPSAPIEFEFRGDVTCMRVIGNNAVVGGPITHFEQVGFPNPQLYHGFTFYVTDNSMLGIPDAISYQFVLFAPPPVCPLPSSVLTIFPVTQGNVVVRDD